MFKIRLTQKARKELQQISRAHQLAIGRILEDLQDNPHEGKALTRELTGRFSYRVGIYRIIYKVQEKDKIIYILTAGHRSRVYQ